MKKNSNSLWAVLLFFLALTSCQSQPDSLATNSVELGRLQDKLSVDPVFKTYREAFKAQITFAMSQRYVPQSYNKEVMAAGIKEVHSKEEYFKLLEKAGIVDPEKQFNTHYNLMVAQKDLYDKYPEIQKMSKDDFKRLMLKFDQEESKTLFPTNRFSKPKY